MAHSLDVQLNPSGRMMNPPTVALNCLSIGICYLWTSLQPSSQFKDRRVALRTGSLTCMPTFSLANRWGLGSSSVFSFFKNESSTSLAALWTVFSTEHELHNDDKQVDGDKRNCKRTNKHSQRAAAPQATNMCHMVCSTHCKMTPVVEAE